MKKITYLAGLILFFNFACKSNIAFTNKNKKRQIKSIKEIVAKPQDPILKALKSNRDSVFAKKFDTYETYDQTGKLIESSRYENNGNLYQKRKNDLNEKGEIIKGEKYNSAGEIIEKWKYIYDNGKVSEIQYFDINGKLTDKQVNKYDVKGNLIEMLLINLKQNTIWKYEYKYNNKNQKNEQLRYKPNGKLIDKRTYKYDEKGNEIEQYLYKPNGNVTKFVSEYDKNNNLILQKWYNENDELINQTSFIYIYDQFNNWITKKSSSNGKIGMIWERKIEYYK